MKGRRWAIQRRERTAVGLCAVVLWSMMFGFVRLTTQSFGPALGSALIYSCAAVFTYIGYRPTPLRRLPLKYVLFSGGLFVFYETAITISIGLAASSEQTLELSLVNYLWPTMLVLLSAFDSGSRASLVRALPGAVVATTGVVLAVGGNNNLDWGAVVADVSSNPLPFALTFAAAAAWAVYSVYSSRFSQGCDATAFFMVGVAAVLWDNLPLRGRARSCGGARLASVFRSCGRCRLHCFGLCLLGAWHAQGRHGENGHRVLCRSFAFGCGEHHHSRRKPHAAVLVWHFRRSGRLPH